MKRRISSVLMGAASPHNCFGVKMIGRESPDITTVCARKQARKMRVWRVLLQLSVNLCHPSIVFRTRRANEPFLEVATMRNNST